MNEEVKEEVNKEEISLWLHFTFFLQNVRFPFSIDGLDKLEKELKKNDIKIHLSEYWEDPHSVRRFLWGFFPHLHLNKKIEIKEVKNIFSDQRVSIDKASLGISTVWGGASMAVLTIEGKLEKEKPVQFEWINNLQDPNNEKTHEVEQTFIKQIIEYTRTLRNIKEIGGENIKWMEWYDDKEKEDYVTGYSKNGEGMYMSGKEISNIINKKVEGEGGGDENLLKFFYQEPYIAVWLYRSNEVKDEERKAILTSFFGGRPGYEKHRKEINLFDVETEGKSYEKKHIRKERIEAGIGKVEISPNFEIYFDPTKCFIFHSLKKNERKVRGAEVHRALFAVRTRMHFCILWEARLQALSQKINDILEELPIIQEKPNELFEELKNINEISLRLSAASSELFNSFIWRYATFLPSRMGYLSTIYNTLDNLLSTSVKTKDIKDYLSELRAQIEFTANFIREKIAEKLPDLIK
ncbi:TPA: hypothetical protein DCX16_02355 [bacterium]|nr:hypothetical protein [bacterium]